MKQCPDCQGELENGYIFDHTYGAAFVQRYVKGEVPIEPDRTFMKMNETEFSDVRRVITYRCIKCNRLYSYTQDFLAKSNDRLKQINPGKIFLLIFAVVITIFTLISLVVFL